MTDILIRGKDLLLPERSGEILDVMLFADGTIQYGKHYGFAFELPEHGELIDRDALMADGWRLYKGAIMHDGSYATHEMPLSNPGVIVVIPSNKEETK